MKILPWIISVVLAVVILLMSQCGKKPDAVVPIVQTKTFTVHDTVLKNHVQYDSIEIPGETVFRNGRVVYLFPTHADTMAILKNCFATRIYDTVWWSADSAFKVESKSKVKGDSLKKLDIKITEKNKILPPKWKPQFYMGGFVGVGLGNPSIKGINFEGVGASLMLNTDKNQWAVSYDPFNNEVLGTVYFKLK